MSCKHRWAWDDRPYKVCTYCGIEPDDEEQRERERAAFKKGAEAMRKQCESEVHRACVIVAASEATQGILLPSHIRQISQIIMELPLPEER